MSDAPEPLGARGDVRFEYCLRTVTQGKVHVSDDARVDLRLAALSNVFVGNTLDEYRFAQGPHLDGAISPVLRRALQEHRLDDVVSGAKVSEQVRQEIAVLRTLPQVVMRVAYGQVGVNRVLGGLGKPVASLGRHVDSFL